MTAKSLAAILLCVVLLFGCVCAEETETETDSKLYVTFMNIGRNDGILIECCGEAAFIDGGNHGSVEKIKEFLHFRGVEKLKYYIGTHGHVDHVGCTAYIIGEFPTECILTNYELAIEAMLSDCKTKEQKELIQNTEVKYVKTGDVFNIGEAGLECIGPDQITRWASYKDGNENSNSLIFRLTLGSKSFILTGDTTNRDMMRMMKANPGMFDGTVFKSPHHEVGVTDDVGELIKCEYYIFSTASNDLPTQGRLNCARKMGARVFVTSGNSAGHVMFITDGETIEYKTQLKIKKMTVSVSKSITLTEGRRKSVTVTIHPLNGPDTIYSTTTDENVAYFDPNTKYIYAVGPGECTIRICAFDDSYAEVRVKVKAK